MNAKETFPPFQISVTEATFEINSQLLIDLNYTFAPIDTNISLVVFFITFVISIH